MQSITNKIYKIMKSKGIEGCFIYSDFLNLTNYDAIRKAFSLLEQEKKIKKVLPGIYYVPIYSDFTKGYSVPVIDSVIKAISRKFGWNIIHNDDTVINYLGLSTQIPAKYIFYTDGPSKTLKINNRTVQLKHKRNFYFKQQSEKLRNIVQSINAIGYERMDQQQLKVLRDMVNSQEKQQLLKECKSLPYKLQKQIMEVYRNND